MLAEAEVVLGGAAEKQARGQHRPFAAAQLEAPSPFVPLILLPVEWRDDKGALVFGWKLTE